MIVFLLSFFMGVASLAAIVYPYKPFSSRKRASIVFAVSIVAFIVSPFFINVDVPKSVGKTTEEVSSGEVLEADPTLPISADSEVIVDSDSSETTVEKSQTDPELILAQANLENLVSDISQLKFDSVHVRFKRLEDAGYKMDSLRSDLEEAALAAVRPLPISNVDANLSGYRLLSSIRPENETYAQKIREYEQSKEDIRLSSVRRLRTEEDKIEGVTWYKHPNQPKYLNTRSTVYLYIGRRSEGKPWLRMNVIYTASDWLFVNKVEAWHDGIKESFISGRFERDHNNNIWEWMDVSPDEYQLAILESLSAADEAVLRFTGDQYRRDVTLSTADKRALREVIQAFNVLADE